MMRLSRLPAVCGNSSFSGHDLFCLEHLARAKWQGKLFFFVRDQVFMSMV